MHVALGYKLLWSLSGAAEMQGHVAKAPPAMAG
eukprot:CAMPEP_0171116126 /NCGR_PEP_ID=MMETSP0766_2-20121228/89622_1 /TAXON_ID=439317 /ORGANISM="Gambierdiscus australes, Strain CAWD 149" /LENGTH=32 /DNA_ID= /DNA_START= /DNA_END= /DNA_ORIENTATION=